jgi:hypothetical protein
MRKTVLRGPWYECAGGERARVIWAKRKLNEDVLCSGEFARRRVGLLE